jgi:hypothetical protein
MRHGSPFVTQQERAKAYAAACVAEKDAKIAELRAALRPFADFWEATISEEGSVAYTWLILELGPRTKPRWSDFRRAAAAWEEARERCPACEGAGGDHLCEGITRAEAAALLKETKGDDDES